MVRIKKVIKRGTQDTRLPPNFWFHFNKEKELIAEFLDEQQLSSGARKSCPKTEYDDKTLQCILKIKNALIAETRKMVLDVGKTKEHMKSNTV